MYDLSLSVKVVYNTKNRNMYQLKSILLCSTVEVVKEERETRK